MVDIKNFQSNSLKIDKKSYEDIDIYYTGYITIKKSGDCENPLYLITYSATGHFKEKNSEKYLIIDSTDKHEEVLSEIRSKIKTFNGGKELFYNKNYAKIKINTDDDLPLNRPLKFATLTIIIRCVFQ